MLSADTGKVRQGLGLLVLVIGPCADTFLNILGEVGIVTEAVGIRVVFAASKLDPGLETAWQQAWSWGRLHGRRRGNAVTNISMNGSLFHRRSLKYLWVTTTDCTEFDAEIVVAMTLGAEVA